MASSSSSANARTLSHILVEFPCPVEIPPKWEQEFVDHINKLCRLFEEQNPREVMWPAGIGSLPKQAWGKVDEGHPQEYDDETFHVEVATRENYAITEAPTLQSVKDELDNPIYNRDTVTALLETAYAIGRKDGIGDPAAQELRRKIRQGSNTNWILMQLLVAKLGGKVVITPADINELDFKCQLVNSKGSSNEVIWEIVKSEDEEPPI